MSTSDENAPAPRFLVFSQRISNELNIVSIDHCYAKPWSSHPDASNARPLHLLFMDKFPVPGNQEQQRSSDITDVEVVDDSTPPMYDVGKARAMMSDCERHAALLRPETAESKDDWEEHIAALRTSWSVLQNRIFAKVMRVLQADRLARLSIQGTKNEPIQRRLQIDKAAKRVRFAFGNVGWDMTLILWLHNLFVENLRGQLLTSYLEVLQTLKAKMPSLIERLIQGTTLRQGGFAQESLNGLLKRNWDPVLSSINQQKLKKLPDNPLLLIISNASAAAPNPMAIKRHKFWQTQLSAMGKVINVVPINTSTNISIANCVENMIATTRSKILEMKGHFPNRPIVLIGWHVGALVATQVALMEVVHVVVCLGFPTMGVCGNRGEVDDQIYNCKTPTLFVIGQHSSSCSLDILEDIRERLRVETGLVMVGGADDQLRMSRAKKKSVGVTQAMVDRCIMDEMFEFLGNILSQIVVQAETFEDVEITKKQRKRKQRDITTTSSSQTGTMPRQTTVKSLKAMKLASAGAVALSGQLSMPGTAKLAKKTSPKKRASKSGMVPSKKPMLHVSFPVITTSGEKSASLSKVSEAAAIASAPELSNLLQSIKPGEHARTSATTAVRTTTSTTSSSSATTIPTTTALTLSKFLASSGFFRTGSHLKEPDQPGEDSESSPVKGDSDLTTDLDPSEFPQATTDSPCKQQPQIVIRTGASSAPFSIPLTFTMASKVMKSGAPVMKITGGPSNAPHIQQLLTSGTTIPIITVTSGDTHHLSTALTSLVTSNSETHPSLSTSGLGLTLGLAAASQSSSVSSAGVGSQQVAATMDSGAISPGASVINIGSDTLFMKETLPGATSVPGTVSIDLGQIASGSTSGTTRTSSAPKISLIPSIKQIPISGSSERLLLTTPFTGSQPSIATLSSLSQASQIQAGTANLTSLATYLKSPHLGSADSVRTLSSATSQPLPKSVPGMSSSQLLSTLSSSAGLITLKLSASAVSPTTSSVEGLSGKDESEGLTRGQDSTMAARTIAIQSSTSALLSTTRTQSMMMPMSAKGSDQQQQQISLAAAKSLTATPTSLIITPGHKLASGQIVLQCRGTPSSSTQSHSVGSPKLVVATTAETLGQVTSLLESSPVTMGNRRKSHTLTSESTGSSSRQSSKVPSSPSDTSVSSSSSSSSLSGQGHTKSSKTTISSYTTTSKPVLPTIASTRTRRIKTPKQYDL